MTYACPTLEFAAEQPAFETSASAKQSSPHHW